MTAGSELAPEMLSSSSSPFTQTRYEHMLDLAKQHYRFADYGEPLDESYLIWRHDIDYSPQRALAMARVEAMRGLKCVYHVLLSGRYYNVLEAEVGAILREIVNLGHSLGLHFDMDVFGLGRASKEQIVERISLEKMILERVLTTEIRSLSFHNYVLNRDRLDEAEQICGLLNVCTPRYRDAFKYVSDSNGLWQYDDLEVVLASHTHPRLQVLTHPVWWTPEVLRPIERVRRAVDGRAEAGLRSYTDVMRRDGRLSRLARLIGLDDTPDV